MAFLEMATKRLTWTLGMTLVGFGLGWHGQGDPNDHWSLLIATWWGAFIGFGFGSIFDKRFHGRAILVFYWAFTLALLTSFFSAAVPLSGFPARLGVAASVGALLGVAIGIAQFRLRDRS
jgi:hypothetical protein